ncbi:MAG: hypothetical protein ACNI3C_09705 [Candidatus Marinarcus sp.]|uniref:hypothetical protein n=1 Tax=Candidatus Marinarcus sp. TaxID=3100987 RepID=UPI003AFFB7CE
MEVGNIPKFEQFENFSQKKVDTVQKTDKISLLNEEVKNKNINNPETNKEVNAQAASEVSTPQKAPKVEFIISNVNFGFNPESRDFYVKVNRSDYVAQYPTDEMMKLKAYLISLSNDNIA